MIHISLLSPFCWSNRLQETRSCHPDLDKIKSGMYELWLTLKIWRREGRHSLFHTSGYSGCAFCGGGECVWGGANRLWRCKTGKVRKRSDKKKRWVSCQVFIMPQHFETAGKKRAILSSRLHCFCSAACNYRTHAFHKWKSCNRVSEETRRTHQRMFSCHHVRTV